VHAGSFKFDDTDLRNNDSSASTTSAPYSDGLMATDDILREILVQPEFQKEMGTAELHYLLGRYCAEWERKHGSRTSPCWPPPTAPASRATPVRRAIRPSA
jgi:deoxyhypusine synthase